MRPDSIRYYLALILVVSYPPAFAVWFFIHPFIDFWLLRQRFGDAYTRYSREVPRLIPRFG